jgi:hypothetical protein
VRLVLSPAWIATAVVVAATAVVTPWTDLPVALVGAVVGLLAVQAANQLGLLVGAPLAGVRARRVVVGIGPRLGDWSTTRRTLTLRALPITLAVTVRATKAPVRRRLWASALCALVTELAVVYLAALGEGPFLDGFAIAGVAVVVHDLLPRRTPNETSTGWLLFRLPWVSTDHARQLEAAPLVGEAVDLAHSGDLTGAEQVAARLRERYPDIRSSLSARIVVLEAQGRYAEAMVLAVKLASDTRALPDEVAGSFAALAGLAAVTVEAGQLDSELGLNTAAQALENASSLGYPRYRLNGVRALLALLAGNPDEAVNLAKLSAGSGDDVLARADDLATLARAHMARGDNQTARQVISEAEKLVSWWPRVVTTRNRLEVC